MGDHARSPGAVVFFLFHSHFFKHHLHFFFLSFFLSCVQKFPDRPSLLSFFFLRCSLFSLAATTHICIISETKKKMPMRRTTTGQGRPPDFDGKEKKQQRRRKIPLYHAAQVRRSENFTTSLRERIFVLFFNVVA